MLFGGGIQLEGLRLYSIYDKYILIMETIYSAKLFQNGNSQAIRLPKSCRFEGEEVLLYKQKGKLVIAPKLGNWDGFFTEGSRASADFLQDRADAAPQHRRLF